MNRLLLLTTACVGLEMVDVVAASGQRVSDSAIARCATTALPAPRLRCYDRLARRPDSVRESSPRPSPLGTRFGRWSVNEQTNPLDDSKTVILSLSAQEGRSGLLGQAPVLVLRCQSAEVEAYIDWHDYMGSDASDVTTRLGAAPPERSEWSHSTDEQATFYPGDHTQFLESLLLVDRFVAQATPYNESPITAVFVLSGLAQAVVPLKAACAMNQRQDDRTNPTALGLESDVATGIVRSSDQVYMESVVEERPEVLSGPQLQYPDLLRRAAIQGQVLVQAIIDTTGRAEPPSVKVIQSPNPGFDQSARNYVLRAMFRPARVHGRAVRVLINIPIDFKVKR